MKPKGRRKRSGSMPSPRIQIMSHLANDIEESERTIQEIYMATGLGKQTIYDSIRQLEALYYVREEKSKPWGKEYRAKYYGLTPRGWYKVSLLKPEIAKKARNKIQELGAKYEDFEKNFEKPKIELIDFLLEVIRKALTTGKAAPGWIFDLKIRADEKGRVFYKTKMSTEEFERESKESKYIGSFLVRPPIEKIR